MARVLITRPEPAASRTARRIAELGHEPVLLPLFETEFLPLDRNDLPAAPSALVFTSRNAVASIADHWDAKGLPAYAVGISTAKALSKAGFDDIRTGPGNADQLAELIIADVRAGKLSTSASSPLLYFAGEVRKPYFEEALKAAHLPFRTAATYRMNEISYSTDFLLSGKLSPVPDIVLLYSANAVKRFSTLFGPQMPRLQEDGMAFHCLSADIAESLPVSWRTQCIIANRADEPSLLETIVPMG